MTLAFKKLPLTPLFLQEPQLEVQDLIFVRSSTKFHNLCVRKHAGRVTVCLQELRRNYAMRRADHRNHSTHQAYLQFQG